MPRPNTASFAPLMMMMTSYFDEHTALPFVMLNLFQRQFICLIVSPRRHERGNGILTFCFFFCDWWAHRLSGIIIVTPVMMKSSGCSTTTIERIEEEGVSLGSTHMLNEIFATTCALLPRNLNFEILDFQHSIECQKKVIWNWWD